MDSRIQEGTGPLIDAVPFDDDEYQRRLDGLRGLMAERELDAFVSFAPENLYYLTGHDTPGYYYMQSCVVTPDQPPINVIRRIEASNTLGRSWKRLVVAYEDIESPVEALMDLLRELGVASKRVGAEASAWFVTPVRYEELRRSVAQASGELIDASGLVEHLRRVKSPAELVYVRQAAPIVEQGMRAAVEASREGATEDEVAAAGVAALTRAGGEYSGIPPIISSGPRTSLVHSTWSGRTLRRGDVLAYELGAVVKRYCVPLYRTGTVGPPTDELRRQAAFVLEVLEEQIAAIRPGVRSMDVHDISRRVAERHGLSHPPKRTAYSLGVNYPPDWGEGHFLSIGAGDERLLEAGMVFHVGHGIFELGRYQIAITKTVLITDDGCEVVANVDPELFVV